MENIIEKEHTILNIFKGKISRFGRYAGIEKNKYWLVKNNKTNEKYTFTIDNGMMILIQDSNNDYTHNIHIDTQSSILNIESDDQLESRYIITLN